MSINEPLLKAFLKKWIRTPNENASQNMEDDLEDCFE